MMTKYKSVDGVFLKDTLVSEDEIKAIVSKLAEQISIDYEDKKLLMIGILKGSFIFLADLVRALSIPAEIAFIKASSYEDKSESSGKIKIHYMPEVSRWQEYDVLIIDDIIDTGQTILELKNMFLEKSVKSVEFCAFLNKPERRSVPVEIKYTGKLIKNEFAVGYGLDYAEKFRNLPYVASVDI